MLPPGNSVTAPPNAQPAATQPGASPNSATDPLVAQLRKSMGLPPDQPVPEAKMVQALTGRLGPQLKKLAETVGNGSTFRSTDGTPGAMVQDGPPAPNDSANGVPSSPDAGQAGGQAQPPSPKGPDMANAPAITPGASDGKLNSRTIFARPSVNATGEQSPSERMGSPVDDPNEDEDGPNTSSSIFRRR